MFTDSDRSRAPTYHSNIIQIPPSQETIPIENDTNNLNNPELPPAYPGIKRIEIPDLNQFDPNSSTQHLFRDDNGNFRILDQRQMGHQSSLFSNGPFSNTGFKNSLLFNCNFGSTLKSFLKELCLIFLIIFVPFGKIPVLFSTYSKIRKYENRHMNGNHLNNNISTQNQTELIYNCIKFAFYTVAILLIILDVFFVSILWKDYSWFSLIIVLPEFECLQSIQDKLLVGTDGNGRFKEHWRSSNSNNLRHELAFSGQEDINLYYGIILLTQIFTWIIFFFHVFLRYRLVIIRKAQESSIMVCAMVYLCQWCSLFQLSKESEDLEMELETGNVERIVTPLQLGEYDASVDTSFYGANYRMEQM